MTFTRCTPSSLEEGGKEGVPRGGGGGGGPGSGAGAESRPRAVRGWSGLERGGANARTRSCGKMSRNSREVAALSGRRHSCASK